MTTRLGFGCAHLTGALSRKQSMAMLECAFDAGIRHFDVARMYGGGDAERCLGEFARSRRDQITITTKLGIFPGSKHPLRKAIRGALRPILRLGRRLKPKPSVPILPSVRARIPTSFTLRDAQESLHASLQALQTGYVDLLLLHEVTAADLQDDRLLQFLEGAVRSGQIGAFGVGTDRDNVPDLVHQRPQYCGVIQHQWSILDVPSPWDPAFRIHHGAFASSVQRYHAWVASDLERCGRWSMKVGVDLSDSRTFADLALKAALLANRDGIVVFASRSPEKVQRNCVTAGARELEAPAECLFDLIHSATADPAAA